MAEGEDDRASEVGIGPQEPTETLSQFTARVLHQLSLSAWLPSAALVLVSTFIFELGAALDSNPAPKSPEDAIGHAFSTMANISLGGAILLFIAVVMLTTLTQAFVFEAIQLLEGYWSTWRTVEWIAKLRCTHFRKKAQSLSKRFQEVTNEAWSEALANIEQQQISAQSSNNATVSKWTDEMLTYLGHHVRWGKSSVKLSPAIQEIALRIPWKRYSSPDVLRRRANLDRRLADFPRDLSRIQPTMLGNILRAYEDQTKQKNIKTFMVRVRDQVPTDLLATHDHHRTQLDVYCSMVFVSAMIAALAAIRLSPHHWQYAIVGVAAGIAGMWLAYRAAIASARFYGLALIIIAKRIRPSAASAISEA